MRTFLGIQAVISAFGLIGAITGIWSYFLGVGHNGGFVVVAAMAGSVVYVVSLLLTEPLAAHGQLSRSKAAAFLGNSFAIPAVLIAAVSEPSVMTCFSGYLLALTGPNVVLAFRGVRPELCALVHARKSVDLSVVWRTLFTGRWFALLSFQWLVKSYLLTFLISALLGPAEAGAYFILLKLSELLSVFGANTSETLIAELAKHRDPHIAAVKLKAALNYTLATSLAAFAGLVCLGPELLSRWFKITHLGPHIGILVSAFGLAGGLSRLVGAACMGAGLTRSVALWGLLETGIAVAGTVALHDRFGLVGVFLAGAASALALIVPAWHLARVLQHSGWELWCVPSVPFVIGASAASAGVMLAYWLGSWEWTIAGLLMAGYLSFGYFWKVRSITASEKI